ASSAASAAYLTVSEVFPLEMRAVAIAVFYACGTGVGGVFAPWLFGWLIEADSRTPLFYGYLGGAALMLAAAAVAWRLGVAAERQGPRPLRILDEIKVGGLAHDVGLGGHHRESGADVNLEVLFASPDIFKVILAPRPHFGVDINSNGKTSSYYGGLTWGGVF